MRPNIRLPIASVNKSQRIDFRENPQDHHGFYNILPPDWGWNMVKHGETCKFPRKPSLSKPQTEDSPTAAELSTAGLNTWPGER